jgi:hypothetical protein
MVRHYLHVLEMYATVCGNFLAAMFLAVFKWEARKDRRHLLPACLPFMALLTSLLAAAAAAAEFVYA